MTEREKMLAGELYVAADPELVLARRRARQLTRLYNATTEEEEAERERNHFTLAMSGGRSPWAMLAILGELEGMPWDKTELFQVDEETLSHIDTTMRYQLTLRAMDSKYGMLRDAIKGA